MSCSILTHALVREYLGRRGYRAALSELDAARPPSEGDVTSRADLVQSLRLEELLRVSRTTRGSLSTLLEHVIDARLADCARKNIRGSTDSDSDDDEVGDGDSSEDSDAGSRRQVALPFGGPLAQSGRPQSARPQSSTGRPARPESAIGRRTPNVVGRKVYDGPTVAELPIKVRAAAAGAPAPAAPAPQVVSYTGRRGEQLVVRPGECSGGTVSLEFLDDCEVLVLDWSSQVTVDACNNCRILVGPVDGSVMLRECVALRVSAVCRQFRCRDCDSCELRLFTFGPVVESSQRMTFGAWSAGYPRLGAHFAAARIDPTGPNKWAEVHDFNDPDQTRQPPNWSTISEVQQAWVVPIVPGDETASTYGRCENPVPAAAAALHGAPAAAPHGGVKPRMIVDAANSGRACLLRLAFR